MRNRRNRRRFIKHCKQWFQNYWKLIAGIGGGIVLAAVIILLLGMLLPGCSGKGGAEEASAENLNGDAAELTDGEGTGSENSGDAAAGGADAADTDTPGTSADAQQEDLLKNAWPEINELVATYFTALQSGDGETIKLLRDNTDAKELLRMQLNGEYIEAYQNLACYTKSGLDEDSYVVFAYYEVKFAGQENLLPGITPLYICRNAEGNLYLHDLTVSDEISQYVGQVAAQTDVTELYAQVSTAYQEGLAADEGLAAFVSEYASKMKSAVGEALEENQEQAAGENTESGTGEQNEAAAGSENGAVPESGMFEVSDTINVRKSASADAERIGVCYPGEKLEIIMKQSDGWTKVKFNGETGYVKTEVLK